MPFKTVLVKGLGKIKFPWHMNDSAIAAALAPLALTQSEDTEAAFLGKLAKNASLDMLGMARKMENAGVNPDEIWQKTGWGKGKDGKWRFEVDDSEQGLSDYGGVTLNTNIDNSPAIQEYPDIGNASLYRFEPDSRNASGFYDPVGVGGRGTLGLSSSLSGPERRSILAHELQHAIQAREGFSAGSNTDEASKLIREFQTVTEADGVRDIINMLGDYANDESIIKEFKDFYEVSPSLKALQMAKSKTTKELDEEWNRLNDIIGSDNALGVYRRNAGEVEARNVQTRLDMSDKERRSLAPWKTEDVPRNKQILSVAPLLAAGAYGLSPSEAKAEPRTASVTGTIEGPAPGRENITKVSEFIDRHDDIVFDDLLGGVTSWLNKLSYDDKITFKDRLFAALDLM